MKRKSFINTMIKREGSRFNVYDEAGKKKLGSHPTRAQAVKQLQAIEISKHRHDKGATQPRRKQLGEK